MSDKPVILLNQASGYGVLVGVGALFAIGMITTTFLLKRYLREDAHNTETFSVANRNVGTFLTASAVYSSWSWATELLLLSRKLLSSVASMVYNYGITAAYFYGAGLTIQIAVLTMIGSHAKKKVRSAHTSLEIVELRYGKAHHILYLFLCLANNLLSCSAMILGASSAISIIAGNLHPVASTLLIPFGVLLYTTYGGLKATFLTDFVHTLILLIILCYLNTAVLSNDKIGGLNGLYDKLVSFDLSKIRPIEGNFDGSVITGKSQGAIFFGLILTAGNFGLSVMDSSFWQKSFSASPKATVPGYLTAAVLIFSNVWGLGSIIGGGSIVLENTPDWPTYPRALTNYEIASGFTLPYTLKTVLGDGAVGAFLLVIYLAVTSTVSAQLISVSSILSFDIYKKYLNPKAQNKSLIRVSHYSCIFFALFSAGFTIMLHYVNVDMTWYTYFYPLIICPGVIPLIFTITWDGQTSLAAFVSPILGLIFGIVVWTTTAYHYSDEVTITSLGGQLPALFGSLTALLLPGLSSIIISLVYPKKFDWNKLSKVDLLIKQENDENNEIVQSSDNSIEKNEQTEVKVNEQSGQSSVDDVEENHLSIDEEKQVENLPQGQLTEKELDFWIKVSTGASIFLLLLTWVLWPMPLYRDWIFSRAYFGGFVTMGLVWVYAALLIIGIGPIISGRKSIAKVFKGVYNDLFNRK
ncbi:unnamed protein product [Candida verbasci]|uniref:Urea active transporter n=1 Tax=Candida verbasci TaxID=1227364 RepID=A0A9W4XCE8_9ASCO|nr:unnamed protein product [Candida verbasci]